METGNQQSAVMEMPRYRSHKTVWALKIKEIRQSAPGVVIEGGSYEIIPADERYGPITVTTAYVDKHNPQPGGYYVVYKDGYHSFSPAEAFEEGNTLESKLAGEKERQHPGPDLRSFTQAEMNNWFSYHTPTPEQLIAYQEIRTAAKIYAETVNRHVPAGADKTAAMRKIRDSVMAANLAVACFVEQTANAASGAPRVDIFERAARAAHEANRSWCEQNGDYSQLPWDGAAEWQKESAIKGVKFLVANPSATPRDQHEAWLKAKSEDGWKYGPVKDADKKEHPCFIPYEGLPIEQRVKDVLFQQVVRASLGIGS